MAFTATITNVVPDSDNIAVYVAFDSGAGWMCQKTYNFDKTITQAQAIAAITADGNDYKANLTKNNALLTKIGTVITI